MLTFTRCAVNPHPVATAGEKHYPDGSVSLGNQRRHDLAFRALAAIRMWPQLAPDSPEAAECSAAAVSCLEWGLALANPQLLSQAAQALSLPVLTAQMCAPSHHL